MASRPDTTLPPTRRSSRKSLGGGQSPARKPAGKENATVDVGGTLAASRKKSRSKSMGPGGVDVLKSGAGNRRVSLSAPSRPPPRSILKPSIPLLQEIPPHKSQTSSRSDGKTDTASAWSGGSDSSGSSTRIALRTEDEQQAAAREREERERAEAEKEADEHRREARRKSLANRRVSFAAEATLHTFHEIEYMQESTTSTDSTRRASSVAAQSPAPPAQSHDQPGSEASDPPSSPVRMTGDDNDYDVAESPAQQRDGSHERRRRRSSAIPPLNFNRPEDDTLGSAMYSSDSEQADGVAEIQGEELSGSDSDADSDVEDGTVMTVDADEMTSASMASVASARSVSSSNESTSLDQNLRLAAQRAATQQLDDDEEDMVAVPALMGWGKQSKAPQPSHGSGPSNPASRTSRSPQSPTKPDREGEQTEADMDVDIDMDMDMDMDMDITKAVGRIIQPPATASPQQLEDEDMSMDVTRAFGGIVSKEKPLARRQSAPGKKLATEEDAQLGEETMEFTAAVGGIRSGRASDGSQVDLDGNEDMSMELTMGVGGGVVSHPANKKPQDGGRRRTLSSKNKPDDNDDDVAMDMDTDTMAMDMTVGVGRILSAAGGKGYDNGEENVTMGMEMTRPLGNIIKPPPAENPDARTVAKKIMEQEADQPDTPATLKPKPKRAKSPSKSPSKQPAASSGTEEASPSLTAFRGKGLRRTPSRAASSTPPVARKDEKPSATKAAAPLSKRSISTTPSEPSEPMQAAGPQRMIGSRSSSPERQATPKRAATAATTTTTTPQPNSFPFKQQQQQQQQQQKKDPSSLFHQDPETGTATPRVVLTPQRRRLSGVGVDRPGLGSPRITEIFDRRDSIGNSAEAFLSAHGNEARKGVSFVDPREMEGEIDREQLEDEERETRRRAAERGSDDNRDATLNLKEMIEGLTPKKKKTANPSKGRKSLHVGSARGLLGKRPAELDEDDEDAEDVQDGVKRLKGHQGSPVKNVKLQSPPSKAETTGRRSRPSVMAATQDSTPPNPTHDSTKTTTPGSQKGSWGTGVSGRPSTAVGFAQEEDSREAGGSGGVEEGRIHLQDFLNMTSIRFMELTTTKRRHTIAPTAPRESGAADNKETFSLEKCVVAGACTVPMLELYQHSCRELKKYISEGRRIVREIESETLEENPPLFREYMAASPDFKMIMDNQFKNVKTHARLLSKAMWYEWRMKLQDGLKEGLVKIAQGMSADGELLTRREELLASVVPGLSRRREALERERDTLEAAAREMADCDPADLEAARADLVSMDDEIAAKTKKIQELRQQLSESEDSIGTMKTQKQACLEEIKASEKIREECRGWSTSEITALKARVDALEKKHGWAISGIAGTTISMTYLREIELVFDMASFGTGSETKTANAPIDLWYIGASRERDPVAATPEMEFILRCIRDQLRGLRQGGSQTKPSRMLSRMLGMVRAAWDKAHFLANQVRLLNVTFPTTVVKTSDSSIAVKCSLLMVPLESKVEVAFHLHSRGGGGSGSQDDVDDVEVAVEPRVSVVYGEQFKTGRMAEFITAHVGSRVVGVGAAKVGEAKGSWCETVVDLHKRLLARGKK